MFPNDLLITSPSTLPLFHAFEYVILPMQWAACAPLPKLWVSCVWACVFACMWLLKCTCLWVCLRVCAFDLTYSDQISSVFPSQCYGVWVHAWPTAWFTSPFPQVPYIPFFSTDTLASSQDLWCQNKVWGYFLSLSIISIWSTAIMQIPSHYICLSQ